MIQLNIKKHNEDYVNNHLKLDKQYLDDVLKKDDSNIKLDEEQRRVVLSDEDYTLVIAGAGAGKTTTIEAMYSNNYTQDKSKIVVMENGRVLKSNIKSEVNKMLENLSNIYSKYQTFKFSYKSLTNFLKGTEDKAILGFKLNEEIGYGMFKDKESYFIPKIISILMDLNVLNKFKNKLDKENQFKSEHFGL